MPLKWLKILIFGTNAKRTFIRAGFLAVSCFVVFSYILTPSWLNGSSMEPTFQDGGFRFINRFTYRKTQPERGDVVAIQLAGNKAFYLKRIVGLPGDFIRMRNGQVFINNQALDEPYLVHRGNWNMPEQEVPTHHYYVVGDNRENPIHAHTHGMVHRDKIVGGLL